MFTILKTDNFQLNMEGHLKFTLIVHLILSNLPFKNCISDSDQLKPSDLCLCKKDGDKLVFLSNKV